MLILPAIDIRKGRCVRLYQGREDRETVYADSPLETAALWRRQGALALHVADLDGAFAGRPVNLEAAAQMKKTLKIPVQVGGGFRDIRSIEEALAAGIDKVILGTAAVYHPELVAEAVERFGGRIVVSIDVSDDYVAVAGWKELSSVRYDDLAVRMREAGVRELLFTDTRKDGTLSGPNVEGIRRFLAAAQVPVTVSGGITTVEDVATLKELEPLGLAGAVIGKALYDRRITLEDAMRIAQP